MKLRINKITKLFGNQKALEKISFSLDKGDLLGLLGPNGAGKSTLMKIITGVLPPTSGEIWLDDQMMSPENYLLRKNIGYLPEHNPLYQNLFVKEYLEIIAGFYHLKNKKRCVEKMIELTGLENESHKIIGTLSKGYKQRVGLAQALIHNPQILVLDEPTTGLDPNQLEDIRSLIKNISQEKTVILSSHIMQEVEAVCNRVVIINRGEIVADGSMADVKTDRLNKRQVVVVEFDKPVEVRNLLLIKGVVKADFDGKYWIVEAEKERDVRTKIFKFAVKNDLVVRTMMQKQYDLESVFHQLTKGS